MSWGETSLLALPLLPAAVFNGEKVFLGLFSQANKGVENGYLLEI